jgi:predicted aspartyl protease
MTRTSPLIKFSFNYSQFGCNIPLVPVRFETSEGQKTRIINAVLDTGSDNIVIREDLANWLKISLTKRAQPANTAGGQQPAFSGTIPVFILGRGGREVRYENIEISVIKNNPAILVGIDPVLDDYIVELDAHNRKFTLTPRI